MDTMNMFTKDEQTILRNTSAKYKWIARDMSGTLFVYDKKPKKYSVVYGNAGYGASYRLELFEDIFKGITWEGGAVQFRKDVLDKTERKYLKEVLRPFRSRVVSVNKEKLPLNSGYYLRVRLDDRDSFTFPSFPTGAMYNGMELYREYTLGELGINY